MKEKLLKAQVATDIINRSGISEEQYDSLLDIMHVYLSKMSPYNFISLVSDVLDIVATPGTPKSTEELLRAFEEDVFKDG